MNIAANYRNAGRRSPRRIASIGANEDQYTESGIKYRRGNQNASMMLPSKNAEDFDSAVKIKDTSLDNIHVSIETYAKTS